jgi:V8-like Glu-specific endopeptidase
MKRILAATMLILIAGLLDSTASQAVQENVYVKGLRRPVTQIAGPSQWIGKLQLPGGGWCTAGLVHRDLILTAGHCMNTKDGEFIPGHYQFHYGFIGGKATESSDVTWFWWGAGSGTPGGSANDWAIGLLAKPLGDQYGWMGFRELPLDKYDGQIVGLTGYASDFQNGMTAATQWGCGFRGHQENRMLRTDCSTSVGASGSPIYRRVTYPDGQSAFEVIAVWVSEYRGGAPQSLVNIPYSDARANLAVPAERWAPTLAQVIADREKSR